MPTKNFSVTKDARIALAGSTELGAGKSLYIPVGLYSGYLYRGLLQFSLNWTGVSKILSATLKLKTSGQYYVAFSSDPDVYVRRNTSSWSEGTSVGLSGSNAVHWGNRPGTTSTDQSPDTDITTSEGTWDSIDITDIVEAWAPTSVKKSDGSPGGNLTNYGITLFAVSEGGADITEFYSRESSYDPYIVLSYEDNSAPNAPTLVSPIGGTTILSATPTLVATHSDPDGDTIESIDVQVSTDNTFSSVTHWDTTVTSAGWAIVGGNHEIVYAGTALSRGVTYYWRERATDPDGETGAWSTTHSFRRNDLPAVGTRTPGSAALAYIHNLNELALWTSGGQHAKPRLQAVYTDPDGHQMSRRIFRIYDSAGSTLLHTSDVTVSAAAGSTITYDSTYACINGTQYQWSVEFYDSLGESSGESSKTTFKVRWAQGLYEYGAGAGSSSWDHTAPGVAANTEAAYIFRSATSSGGDSASGKTAWKSTIGAVTPLDYVQILVRLSTKTAGTNPALASMTFSYLGSASQPDRWTFDPSSEWVLDPAVRRFGSKSLKCSVQSGVTGDRTAYPFRKTTGDDVPVLPDTTYTISGWIKTDDPLTGGTLSIRVYKNDGITLLATTDEYDDTSEGPDGWLRIKATFTTPSDVTLVRPTMYYDRSSGVTEAFWVDGMKLEEGTVATAWTPGFVGDAVVLDANGIAVDGTAGGIARFRGATGGARDVFELGPQGVLLGGDTEITSPLSGEISLPRLRITATDDVSLSSTDHGLQIGNEASTNIVADGNEIEARNNGAAASLFLNSDGGAVVVNNNATDELGGLTVLHGPIRQGGTAFPSSPSNNDLYYRTDLDTLFFYNGTRWLSVAQNIVSLGGTSGNTSLSATANNTNWGALDVPSGYSDVWVEQIYGVMMAASGGSALSGSHKWDINFNIGADNGGFSAWQSWTLDSGSSNVIRPQTVTVGALLGSNSVIQVACVKTGSPGNLFFSAQVRYRLVAT